MAKRRKKKPRKRTHKNTSRDFWTGVAAGIVSAGIVAAIKHAAEWFGRYWTG